jgi:O-antigen/teichoic acid export membrane protein
MPTTALLTPLGRVLYPAFVSVRSNPEGLRRSFRTAMSVQVLVVLPAAIGLALVAGTAVPLLLGKQWMAAVPFVQILGLVNLFTALRHSASYVLLATGRNAARAGVPWINVVLMAISALLLFPSAGAKAVAVMRLVLALVTVFAVLRLALGALDGLTSRMLLKDVWRPFTGCVVMAGTVALATHVSAIPDVAQLALQVLTGVLTYSCAVLALWAWSGRPDGAEMYLARKLGLGRSWPAVFGEPAPTGAMMVATDGSTESSEVAGASNRSQ